MKRLFLLLLLVTIPGWCQPEILDLTYSFDDKTIYWPTAKPFQLETVFQGQTEAGFYYEAFNFSAAEHGGTHVDAPIHFSKGQWSVDQVPLENLIGPAIKVDISQKAANDRDAQLTIDDLMSWEKRHGPIPKGCLLMVYTGWGQYWGDKARYLGTDKPGDVANLHFPGVSSEAALWLIRNRDIKALGIDTPSVDYGQSKLFKTHRLLYGQNIAGIENVAHLDKLPIKGATVYAIPMKIRGGSGAPCRIFATGWK